MPREIGLISSIITTAFFSLSVTLLLVPLVLYRIHQATTGLMMEADNIKSWWLMTAGSNNYPLKRQASDLTQILNKNYSTSKDEQSASAYKDTSKVILSKNLYKNTSTTAQHIVLPVTGNLHFNPQCSSEQVIQEIVRAEIRQVCTLHKIIKIIRIMTIKMYLHYTTHPKDIKIIC